MHRTIFLTLLSLLSQVLFVQEEIKDPFKLKVNIDHRYADSTKLVVLDICNKSLKTIYLSDYSIDNSVYLDESTCVFSLNYSMNYSDPLLMPNVKLTLWRLQPFQCFTIRKIKKSNYMNTVSVDFDFFSKRLVKKSSVKLKKVEKGKKVELVMKELFHDLIFNTEVVNYYSKKIKVEN